MSSPALSDSQVLQAFTAAYNDKFRELMRASSAAASPSAVSKCSACRPDAMIKPTVVEIVETTTSQIPSSVLRQKPTGSGVLWTIVIFVGGLLLLVVLGSSLCRRSNKKYKKLTLAGTPLSVEASMSGGGPRPSAGVREISDPSQVVPNSGRAIVMYMASWCGHCKEMKPLFERAAREGGGSILYFACDHEVLQKSGKSEHLGIQGYPTIIAFNGGSKVAELVGNVGAEKLKDFINRFSKSQ